MNVVSRPLIPDRERLSAIASLCELRTPYAAGSDLDALFLRAMRENVEWHATHSDFYRRVMKLQGFDCASLQAIADLARVPMVPAVFFKTHEILSLPRESITLTLTSSGTQGQKSQMFFDDWSIRAPQRMVEFIFDHYGWITPERKVNYLLYTYEVEPDSKLGTAYTDNFLCGFASKDEAFYALRRTGEGSHEFDAFGTIAMLERFARAERPVRIFGFPAFLHFTLKRMRELKIPRLSLSPQSLVFLGGGWKGHADQAVRKEDLYAAVHDQLGIPLDRIRDGFGSVEHCIPYVECSRHRFHVPCWSRVLIRDVKSLQPLPYGKPGFLNLISPYITSVPAQSVLMGDLATLSPPGSCECGLPTPWFTVLGRAGTSRNKSCAVAASELLKGKG